MWTNTKQHAADALADVRAEIAALQDRERELISYLITHPGDRAGVDYYARAYFGVVYLDKNPAAPAKDIVAEKPVEPAAPPAVDYWHVPTGALIVTHE